MNQPNAMLTFGLLPNQEIVSIYTDESGEFIDPPDGQLIPLVKFPAPETGDWAPVLVWFDDRVERQWEAAQPPPPLPDFDQLRNAIRTENGYVGAFNQAAQADPMATGLLGPRLDTFQLTGNYNLFLESLRLALQAIPDAQQAANVGLEFLGLAHRCNMTAPFLMALEMMFNDEQPPQPGGEG